MANIASIGIGAQSATGARRGSDLSTGSSAGRTVATAPAHPGSTRSEAVALQNRPLSTSVEPKPTRAGDTADSLHLSTHADFMNRLRSLPPVRQDRVDSVRDAIDTDGYESDEKLMLAIERLIDDLPAP